MPELFVDSKIPHTHTHAHTHTHRHWLQWSL